MTNKILYVDSETGNLDTETGALLQLSAIAEIDNVVVEARNWFIKPLPQKSVTKYALDVQKVDWADLDAVHRVENAVAFREFVAMLKRHCNNFAKEDKFYFKGFHSRYDEDVVRTFFKDNGDNYYGSWFWAPSIDIMSSTAQACIGYRPQMANFRLGTVLQTYKIIDAEGYPLDASGERIPGAAVQLHDSRGDIEQTRRLDHKLRGLPLPEPLTWLEPEALKSVPRCSVCNEYQQVTSSGNVCKNGHGGAPGV